MNDLRKRRTRVAIYLKSGVRVEGIIASFDTHVIEVKGATDQIIFKQMITTISPGDRQRGGGHRGGGGGGGEHHHREPRRERSADAPRPSVIVKRRRTGGPPRE